VTTESQRPAPLQPRWFIRSFWVGQRAVYSVTRGRFGLRTARADRWGMLRLRTVGRHTGQERVAILGYFEDGADLVTMAMNGWADAEPAWWLNLQAQPDVTVDLPGGSRAVHGRAANEDERPRLWARWAAFNQDEDLGAFAARRSRETAVVILSPRPHAQLAGTGPCPPPSLPCQYEQIGQGGAPAAGQPGEKTETMTHNRIPGALRPLLAVLVIGLVATGCTFATVKAAEMSASCDQFSAQKSIAQTAEMAVGDQITVSLCSNPTTGFSWQEPEISGTGAVSLVDKSFGAPVDGESPAVGAAGTEHITLKATATGTSTVALNYSQPWAGGTTGEWTYTLTVSVK
jgi:deazaflavin-dependent oxidoreductase (nitroreductase family)